MRRDYPRGLLPTDRRYTGQRWDEALALYDYNARYYHPGLGRFISADPVVPNPRYPQDLNRYAYARNSPLAYVDPDGHFAIAPGLIVVGVVVLKAVDYGWTAYDVYNDLRVFNDPNASDIDRQLAGTGLAMAVTFEGSEFYDELIHLNLPIDDIAQRAARKGVRQELVRLFTEKVSREAAERVAREGLEGSIDAAMAAAKQGDEILPGLFKYKPGRGIEGYTQHHLWPKSMGGPEDGWIIYTKGAHWTEGGIQGRLNQFLRDRLGKGLREIETWARDNPDLLLPLLREFYEKEKIPFPYR